MGASLIGGARAHQAPVHGATSRSSSNSPGVYALPSETRRRLRGYFFLATLPGGNSLKSLSLAFATFWAFFSALSDSSS